MAALAGWGLINHHPPGPRPGSRRAWPESISS